MTAEIEAKGMKAVLGDDGVWSSGNEAFARYLNLRFGKELIPPSPAAGKNPFGRQAVRASKVLKVEVKWGESEPGDPDAIY